MRVDCNIQQEIEQRRVELHELAGKHGRIDSIIILKSKQLDDLLVYLTNAAYCASNRIVR